MGKTKGSSTWHVDDVALFVRLCKQHSNCYSNARRTLDNLLADGRVQLKSKRLVPEYDRGKFLRRVVKRYERNSTVCAKWRQQTSPSAAVASATQVISAHIKHNSEGKPYLVGSTRQLERKANPPVSHMTIKKCLKQLGLACHKQCRVNPYANSAHNVGVRLERIERILSFYSKLENNLLERLTIFTDEKQFVADTDSQGRIRIYAASAADIPYDDLVRKVNDKIKVHVWIAFNWYFGCYVHVLVDEKGKDVSVNQAVYREQVIAPFAKWVEQFSNGAGSRVFVFQQDGAPPHQAYKTLEYLRTLFGEVIGANRGEGIFAWPPYTPHASLNDFWGNAALADIVSAACRGKFPNSKKELAEHIKTAAPKIPLAQVQRAVMKVVPRLKEIKEKKGYVTDNMRGTPKDVVQGSSG